MSGEATGHLPKISVITPVLNGEATLRRTMLSIIEQQYPNLEYIVVDGGSKDGSPAIIAEYGSHVTRLLQGKDRTMYDAVAKGFDAATGEVFCWLNSDDMFEPGILLRIGRLFADNPRWKVIYCDDTVWKQGWHVANRPQRPVGLPELLSERIIPQASTFFRREAYLEVGGLERERLRFAGDYQLWLRFAARTPLHFLPVHASTFGIRPDQLSGDWGAYMKEVSEVAAGARAHLPRYFRLRSRPGVLLRKLQNRRIERERRPFFPFRDQQMDWPGVEEPPRRPLHECRCPVCGEYPERLLLSTPDTRFGDRRLWRYWTCRQCALAFRFPHADVRMLREIRARASAEDFVNFPEIPPGVFSPFKPGDVIRGRRLYTAAGMGAAVGKSSLPLRPPRAGDASPLIIEAWKDGSAAGCDIFDDLSEKPQAGVIVLRQSLQHVSRPVEYLATLKGKLLPGGRIELTMPNLDSLWVSRFGPCWSQWHAPFHAFVTGAKGLSRIASRAGFAVERIRTTTPPRWLYMSEQLASRGLAGHFSGDLTDLDASLWRAATGASRIAALTADRRGRGDCLHAVLKPR